jgi:ABC-type transport system involved in cytochrome c biogenesis permease subunit
MAVLIEFPWLALLIGAVLVTLGRRLRRQTAVVVGGLWVMYGLYETGMRLRWLCSGECNIRIDLLLLYPVLLVATVAAVVSLLRARSATGPTA